MNVFRKLDENNGMPKVFVFVSKYFDEIWAEYSRYLWVSKKIAFRMLIIVFVFGMAFAKKNSIICRYSLTEIDQEYRNSYNSVLQLSVHGL